MIHFYNKLNISGVAFVLFIIVVFTCKTNAQYIIQAPDVTLDNSTDYISSCSITDFSTSAYQNGNIEIPGQINGITIIGINGNPIVGGAFQNKGITALHLHGSISQIEFRAFADNSLTSLIIPEGVKDIGIESFKNNLLTSVILPKSVVRIYENAFTGNTGLTGIILPVCSGAGFIAWEDENGQAYPGGTTINDFTLLYTAKFTTSIYYTLTDADISIVNGTITACTNTCNGTHITIPDTIQNQEVIGIDANVFTGRGITNITLPTPEKQGFITWLSDKGITYAGGSTVSDFTISYAAQFTVNVPYTLTNADVTMSNGIITACSDVRGGTNITIPDTLQSQEVIGIHENVFSGMGINSLKLPVPAKTGFVSWLSGTGLSYLGGSVVTDVSTSYSVQFRLTPYVLKDNDVVMIDGIIKNCTYKFYSKNIIIPDTLDGQAVTGIYQTPFAYKGIVKLQLPNTIKKIDDLAFYGNGIESIMMPDSAFEIGVAAFNDNAITEINGKPSNGFMYARNNDGSTDYTTIVSYGGAETEIDFIPNAVTTISNKAFVLSGLTKVIIPNSITSIGSAAFNWNTTITEINGNPTNGIVFDRNPDGSEDSTTIVSYCGLATDVDFISNTVTKIGEETFRGSGLTNVVIPVNVDTIGEKAFYQNNITNVSFATNGQLKLISTDAFTENTGLSLTLPNSNIPNFSGWIDGNNNMHQAGAIVGASTSYTANLPYTLTDADVVVKEDHIISCINTNGGTAITIPDSLDGEAIIGVRKGVFSHKGVVLVYLPMHSNLTGFSGWLDFDNNTLSLNSGKYVIDQFDMTYIAKMPNYTLTSMDVVMQNNYIQSCSFSFGIKNIVIPNTLSSQVVKGIGEYCFYNKGITAIQLPSSLEYIGKLAFTRNQFASITIPASVTRIDESAFNGYQTNYVSPLKQVYFEPGSKLTIIGYRAFNWCKLLRNINIPEGVSVIEDEAFCECDLTTVTIPQSVIRIGKQAFSYQGSSNNSLTSVFIEDNSHLLVIGEGAFASNFSLAGVGFNLPTSAIDNFFYWGCSGVGSTKFRYSEGENTQVFTAEYTAQYAYTLTSAEVVVENNYIKRYNKNDESLYITIPDTLDGQAVKGIAEIGNQLGIFSYNQLRSITLPSTLEYIPADAFAINYLTSVTIPDKVVHVGHSAFKNNSIDSIILPNHTTAGFIGWIDEEDTLVTKSLGEYVITDLFVSYTAAYEVLFNDYDGVLLKKDTVKHSKSAVPPNDPSRMGYTFIGWDMDYSKITQGITLTAQYSKIGANNYTVTFVDWNNRILNAQIVTEGFSATAPSDPTRTGYTFTNWDADFSQVTSDLIVTAQYAINSYTVIFKGWDGMKLDQQSVDYGNAAINPAPPVRENYNFIGWFEGDSLVTDFSNITMDITVFARYSVATSVGERGKDKGVMIYPNPVKNKLIVEVYDLASPKYKGISIIDITGSVVYQNTSLNNKQTIDISSLSRGVYFVQVANIVKKFIKE